MLRRFVGIRVLGKGIARELSRLGIKNTVIMDNGVYVPNGISYIPGLHCGMIKILFVGIHSYNKGFDMLVRACGQLHRRNIGFELHTIGEWCSEQFRQEMLRFIDSADLADVFHCHGLCTGRKKWSIFARSQVLVLPSLSEGQPLTILEALGCGLPVVATNVGGIREIIEDGINGFIVEPGTDDDLAKALAKIAESADFRRQISAANRTLYESRFTVDLYTKNCAAWLLKCADK